MGALTADFAHAQEPRTSILSALAARQIALVVGDVDQVGSLSRALSFQLKPLPPANVGGRRPPSELVSLYSSYAALQVLDAHSTIRAVHAGAREWNPLMSGVASRPLPFLLVKGGTTAATIYLTEKLRARNRAAAVVLMVGLNGACAAIVAHNYASNRAHP